MDSAFFPESRSDQVEYILSELRGLKPRSKTEEYAIKQNIQFFNSIRSVFSYCRWLYSERKKIQSEDLLELNELLPGLDEIFHAKMVEIERRPRPGVIYPVVEYATGLIANVTQKKRFRLASLGSGGMEAERQIIERIQKGTDTSLTIVGFDISPNTRMFAERNLATLSNVRIVQEVNLTEERLFTLEQETHKPVLVIITDNDIFTLHASFSPKTFDLTMSVLFLHHLPASKRARLTADMRLLALRTLQYDGYQNEIIIPILSATGWHSPVFLNAAIFSSIRFPNRNAVQNLHTGASVDFYYHGHYRAIFPL